MLFGWSVEQGVTSNSVLFIKDGATVGIGTGEQDRVGVAEVAVFKAYKKLADDLAFRKHGGLFFEVKLRVKAGDLPGAAVEKIDAEVAERKGGIAGGVAISDAFFPKRDGVDACIQQGVTGIVQPGGSLADRKIIEACNEAGVSMMFTGQRAFKH
jgi:phosphoribosylaminoimidazolecarboxamide formyltransferase/IMP cyclohydrolase